MTMKMLIITQVVDTQDPILGFFHRWIEEFAKHCEQVTVIALKVGTYSMPKNVKVLSLGKEDGAGKLRRVYNFYKYIWKYRKEYDNVFVHMNTIYILLGGVFWKLLRKRVGLWYAHGHVPLQLRIAQYFVHYIFSSTKSGCRLRTNKIHVVGQGIDTNAFCYDEQKRNARLQQSKDELRLIMVGRISPVKNFETFIKAVYILRNKGINASATIVGEPALSEQYEYLDSLHMLCKDLDMQEYVHFVGALPNDKVILYLQDADICINTSMTGSMDKVVLEAMAVGIPSITCNVAFKDMSIKYGTPRIVKEKDVYEFTKSMIEYVSLNDKDKLVLIKLSREIIVSNASLSGLVHNILSKY